MTIVYRDGHKLDERSGKMFDELQRLLGMDLRVVQGSYSGGVGASAGTHNGGGALDIDDTGMSEATRNKVVFEARRVGFAAWWRPTRPGVWGSHFHAVAIGCPDLADVAERQVLEYYEGGDGLVGGNPDPHRSLNAPKQTWERYLATKRPPFPLPTGHSFGTPKSSAVHDGTANVRDAENVKRIQHRLGVGRTGRFGAYTKARVIAWQVWKRIPASGRVGATTWKAMGL